MPEKLLVDIGNWVDGRLQELFGDAMSLVLDNRIFKQRNVDIGIVSVDGANSRAYISLEHGHFGTKVHRSDDKGANWVEVSCPEYPEQPEGWVEAPNAFTGKVTPWSSCADAGRARTAMAPAATMMVSLMCRIPLVHWNSHELLFGRLRPLAGRGWQ